MPSLGQHTHLNAAPCSRSIHRALAKLTRLGNKGTSARVKAQGVQAGHEQSVAATADRRQILAALTTALASLQQGPSIAQTLTVQDVTPPVAPPASLTQREKEVIDVFDKNTTSVVNIFDITLRGRGTVTPEVDVPEGNGSGVVWDKEGHIVTNFHVLGNVLRGLGPDAARKQPRVARITILGQDGLQQTVDGVLVGVDKARDLAVLKVNVPPEQLRPVSLGTSAGLRVGQQVLAIGCPFGFDHTLTTGVVSGLNREIRSIVGTSIPGGIQTDAAINPGNSGGPLLDSSGALVGLNTAIFTNTGTSVGVSFAIPVDTIARIVPQLITNGKVVRPTLGVQFANEGVAARLKVTQGALIQAIQPGSAAEKAGLLPTRRGLSGIITGDVITQVDTTPIKSPTDVTNALDLLQVGQTVTLRLLRSGEGGGAPQANTEVEVSVQLGAE